MNSAFLRRVPQLSTLLTRKLSERCARVDAGSSYRLLSNVPSAARVRGRPFSSKSAATDEERIRNDPEVRAWMDQLSQHFGEPHTSQSEFTDTGLSQGDRETAFSTRDAANIAGFEEQTLQSAPTSDVEIEDFGYQECEEEEELEERREEIKVPISLERGKAGVFDMEELVTVLEEQNGVDIQVLDIPPEARFVDHMIIVSGKSLRHMRAMVSTIHWLYNRKRRNSDKPFKLEGKDCSDWLAMDLGNVAVHIFTPEARQHYDLETLWTLGPEHDDERHYVHDEHVNLSAAELFWLESGMNQPSKVQENSSEKKGTAVEMQDESTNSTRCAEDSMHAGRSTHSVTQPKA